MNGLPLPPLQSDRVQLEVVPPYSGAALRRRPLQRPIKRAFDIIASLMLILLMLPMVLVVAAAVVIDSPGPIFFVQRRVGRLGAEFPLLKFRTMVADGEAALAERVASDVELLREWERSRKLRNDPRVTRVGTFLRRHSIDEMPQLINVLRGDMSLVGPRPVRTDEIAYFGERALEILGARPGLTGLWAVSGRSDLTYEERAGLEYRYVADWNLWLDVRVLMRTIPVVVRGRGAY